MGDFLSFIGCFSNSETVPSRLLSLSTSGPSALRLRRLQRHLAVVAQDDALLKGESLGGKLTKVELRDALEERGLYVNPHGFVYSIAGLTIRMTLLQVVLQRVHLLRCGGLD